MKIVIFLDGAFWHGNKEVQLPKSNKIFWKDKILSNKKRDRKVDKTLRGEGWTVIRFWDFELKKSNEIEIIRRLRRVITIKRKENA